MCQGNSSLYSHPYSLLLNVCGHTTWQKREDWFILAHGFREFPSILAEGVCSRGSSYHRFLQESNQHHIHYKLLPTPIVSTHCYQAGLFLISINRFSKEYYQLGTSTQNMNMWKTFHIQIVTPPYSYSFLLSCLANSRQSSNLVSYQMLLFGDDTALYFGSTSFDAIWKLPQNRKPEQILHSLHGFPFWGES